MNFDIIILCGFLMNETSLHIVVYNILCEAIFDRQIYILCSKFMFIVSA